MHGYTILQHGAYIWPILKIKYIVFDNEDIRIFINQPNHQQLQPIWQDLVLMFDYLGFLYCPLLKKYNLVNKFIGKLIKEYRLKII